MNFVVKPLTGVLALSLIMTGVGATSGNGSVTRAAEPLPAAPMPQGGGATLLAQGRGQLKAGNAAQALISFNQALAAFKGANDVKGQAATEDALGDLYSRQGQYPVALSHYQEANRAFASSNDTYNANLMWAKVGDMYYQTGNLQESRNAFSQMSVTKPEMNAAKQTQAKVSKGTGMFGKIKGIGSGGVSGASSAVETANDAKNMVDEERNTYRQFIIYSIYELGLGRLDVAGNQADSAKTHYTNALTAADNPIYGKFGQAARWRVASRTGLGDVALSQSRYPDAVKLYTQAADGARKDKRADMVWPAQRGIGRAWWAQASTTSDAGKAAKMREDSITSYRAALVTIEGLRAGSIGSDESKTTFLATTADVYNETASALAERALLTSGGSATLSGPALADASDAFKIVEQSRARSLLDMLGEIGANLTDGVPADLLQKKQANLARQQEIAEVLTGASLNPDAQKKSTGDLEKELDGLQVEYDSIENQIRTANPRYGSLTKPQPLTLAEVQQQVLDDKTALLTYSLGTPNSYLWAVTQNGVSLYKLPARDVVDGQAFAMRTQLIPAKLRTPIAGINLPATPTRGLGLAPQAAGPAAEYAKAANELYTTAVAPAASVIGDKRVLVVADGALNYVPFEAMVTAPGGADYAALPYMIKTNEIVYAPSASVLAIIRKQATKPTGKAVLVVADPVFNSNDPRAKGATAAAAGGGDTRGLGLSSALTDVAGTPAATANGPVQGLMLARLNGTRAEAEQIAALTKTSGGTADVLLDLNASESNLETRDLKNYRVIHVATHGLLNADRPQFSGVVLSLVGNKSGDGFLRTDEIFNLKLGSPLVMLSACETGLGKSKKGEGVIGLTRAFMYAGAPTVGVSLWSVSDASTALLMTDMYKRMLTGAGMPPAAALRASQQGMIAGKKYSAPFYWAPFVLVGEWR
jgi:CHAT domain-containing protein/tetratricopeptide (TPR) repeat protein